MSNELQIINNPTSTPQAMSTGYQRQNVRAEAASVGMDSTVVEAVGASVKLKVSGPADVNGVLYSVISEATLTPPNPGSYYIRLAGSGANLTPELVTDAGTFYDEKNARYDGDGYRVLNWFVYNDGTAAYVSRWVTPEHDRNIITFDAPEEWWITESAQTWVAPRSKVYEFLVTGSGGSTTFDGGSGGGGAGLTGIKRLFVNSGDTWTMLFTGTATTFSDGEDTLSAGDGADATSQSGALGSAAHSGDFDAIFPGGDGGGFLSSSGINLGGGGGASFWGGGGRGTVSGGGFDGANGKAPGSGAGGKYGIAFADGVGASGLVRIRG